MDDEIRALAAALLAKLGADQPSPRLSELFARYSESPEARGLRAWATERGRLLHLHEHLGNLRASELSQATIDDYRKARAAEAGHVRLDGKGKLTAPATRNREVARLVRVLNWAVERKLISACPIERIDEQEPAARLTSITSADIDELRAAALEYGKDPRIGLTLRAMISTKFDAFLRRSEMVGLRWPQVDFAAGTITLQLSATKAHRDGTRITILSDRASADIKDAPRYVGSPYVFSNTRGRRYNARTFLRMLQRVAEAAGITGADGENFVAHDLRAGGASEQLELGTPERDVMDMAGWTTRDMIDRYYRRRGAQAVARAKARLEKARLS